MEVYRASGGPSLHGGSSDGSRRGSRLGGLSRGSYGSLTNLGGLARANSASGLAGARGGPPLPRSAG